MVSPKLSKEKLEGLVAGCLDLYESYGFNLLKVLETPPADVHFSISSDTPSDEELSEEEKKEIEKQKEAERKEEELRQKKESEKNKKRREKISEYRRKGREKDSYKALKPLKLLDPTSYEYLKRNNIRRICSGKSFLEKMFRIIREKVKQKQSENKLFPALKHSFFLAPTFSEMLVEYMREKNMESKDVYEAANIDRRLFSKILSDTYYQPSKEVAIYLCFALRLNIDEAVDFLATAGYSLSKSIISDIVVEYLIRTGIYNIEDIQEVVDEIRKLVKLESDD